MDYNHSEIRTLRELLVSRPYIPLLSNAKIVLTLQVFVFFETASSLGNEVSCYTERKMNWYIRNLIIYGYYIQIEYLKRRYLVSSQKPLQLCYSTSQNQIAFLVP